MPADFTAIPTPTAPTYAGREALRLMGPMLRQLTEHRHCEPRCDSLALALSMKHYTLDLIERAEGRA